MLPEGCTSFALVAKLGTTQVITAHGHPDFICHDSTHPAGYSSHLKP
jgi:hypothetical protein